MRIKSNVADAVIYAACATPIVVVIVLMLWLLAGKAKVFQPVANEVADTVANGVVNNTANSVTTIETEVYRVVCVESADGYCKDYSVRKINRE